MNEITIAAFLKRNIAKLRYTSRENLIGMIRWHGHRHSIAFVEDENKKLLGVGMIRPVAGQHMIDTPYNFEEGSDLVHIENMTGKHPSIMATLLVALKVRCPQVKKVSFHRGDKLKVYDFQRFFDRTLKIGNLKESVG